ncbi:ABC transporter permease [Natrarchaeobius halalkaliphilus]|uniref:ABC transporter permease n=2 Tax=Natrarchaeobius halalkaliphilus TaxID=1679091 RepID=A0A3N6LJH7_9EURY|nr:ABC transporter permease [Natrarchaeobius halalkaliphilus]
MSAAVVLVGVSVLTFGLIYLTPGDPAETILSQQTDQQPSQEAIEAFRAEHGLNEPIPHQYVNWVGDALQADLGQSYYSDRSVNGMIVQHAPATVELAIAAMAIALLIAIPTGVLSAVHRGGRLDVVCQFGALVGVSMPNFWLGYLLIIGFSLHLGLFPVSGSGGLAHLVLPAVTLGTGVAAIIARLVRTSMLAELDREYLDVTRAKGLSERIVVYKHAFRNALLPVITVVALQFGFVLNGAVVVEIVFQRPGLGTLLVDSIFARDYPVVQGVVLVTAVSFVLTNLLVDLSYRYLDPRIRLGGVGT